MTACDPTRIVAAIERLGMRSTTETLELDSSLRRSRAIYLTLAVILFPLAFFGVVNVFSAVGGIVESLSSGYSPTGALLAFLFGAICIGAEYVTIGQCIEANRRLRTLRDDPDRKVRKMSAPFQSSLFGPYH
jgi:hypothetical protein